jgi:putative phosphoesterase
MHAMHLLLLSDTHGFVDPRIVALARTADRIVHAGDIGAVTVLDELSKNGADVLAVRGNNDVADKLDPRSERLARLPEEESLELPGGRLVVLHGHQVDPARLRHERLRRRYAGARAILYGHTHRAVIDRAAEPWVLNGGAAGRVRTHGGPSCVELTIDGTRWRASLRRFPPLPRAETR